MGLILISWNVARRSRLVGKQIEALALHAPDIVCLQEVRFSSVAAYLDGLRDIGLTHSLDTSDATPGEKVSDGAEVLIAASRWPIGPADSLRRIPAPMPRSALSAQLACPSGIVELHNVHVPNAAQNGGDLKLSTLESIYRALASQSNIPRLLCGDFNTEHAEKPGGPIVPWVRNAPRGAPPSDLFRVRWKQAELNVMDGLSSSDLPDVYQLVNGYGLTDYSWYWRSRGRVIGRRFDHVFASRSLDPRSCQYLHALREAGLSDHSGIGAFFEHTKSGS